MLTTVKLPVHTVTGVSVGGVYTALVPELNAIFDAGIAPRSFVGEDNLFISHGHADHVGALPAMMGVRGLAHRPAPRTFLPQEICSDLSTGVEHFNRGQHRKLAIDYVSVAPGQDWSLGADLRVRAFRTMHTVPSVGYYLYRSVKKLRSEFAKMSSREIVERKSAGEDLFRTEERGELAYVTDTLIDVLDENPELYHARTLILECTFIDDRKTAKDCRDKFHVHLDEIIARAERFENESLVLMHFSQTYAPEHVHRVLKSRLPEPLRRRVRVFAPQKGPWPG